MRKLTQLPSQNADLHLIRCVLDQLNHLVDAIEAERQQNAIQDAQLTELKKKQEQMWQILHSQKSQIQSQQAQLEECQESADYAVREVRHLTHLLGEKEELENRLAFYCPPD
jgi:predicted  nucleic acid-binding Zn-ribbon protein